MVVVYKVDRLTRSLSDFAKLVDVFDEHAVSFVSVTQQFNTTSSMGRLTLNMLLSFAQFEREVTGERIRDKLAASMAKGMWMGGTAPLGYAPNGRSLKIIPDEAETVRTIYQLYLEVKSVSKLAEELDRRKIRSKRFKTKTGNWRGGHKFAQGGLYKLLANPIYLGKIRHKKNVYEGLHEAILDQDLWDAVQKQIEDNRQGHKASHHLQKNALLKDKMFDPEGDKMVVSHVQNHGKRYHYYITSRVMRGQRDTNAWRLPKQEIEGRVERIVREAIVNPPLLIEAAKVAGHPSDVWTRLHGGIELGELSPFDLVKRVDLAVGEITITLAISAEEKAPTLQIKKALHMQRRGLEQRLVLAGETRKPDPALVKLLVRGIAWLELLTSGKAKSVKDIAEKEGLSGRYISKALPFAFLSPRIQQAIMIGAQPVDLTAKKLAHIGQLPLDWTEQETLLGFPKR